MTEARDNFLKRYPQMFVGKDKGLGSFEAPEGGFQTRIGQIGSTLGEGIDYGLDAGAIPIRALGRGIGNIFDYFASPPKATQELEKIKNLYGDRGFTVEDTIEDKSIPLDVLYGGQEGKLSEVQDQINKLTNQTGKNKGATESQLTIDDDETFGLGDTKNDATKADGKKEEIKKQSLDDLVDSSAESFLKSLEGDDFKVRSLDEYKKDFADATGLDTSGKADKSTALMALGLALMQNKAGKGFNVSNMLSAVGEAGEKALPALEKAKSEAKQAQLAAGQYALQSRDRDTADKKSRLTELANYKRNRRDTLSDYYRQLGDQKTVDYIKHQYDKELKYIDYAQEKLTADAKGDEFKSIYQDKLLPGNEQVKVGYGFIGTEPKFINPTVDATQVTQQYIKGQRALTSLDRLDGLLASLESEQSPAGTILFDRGKSVLSALGIGKPEEWFGERGISRESEAQAIINVLIQENKRFITQETGNGVSEGDKEDIKNVLGRIELAKNPRENRLIIAELRGIFDNPMTVLENQVTSFLDDKNKYVDNQTYQNTVSEIENLLGGAQNVLQQTEFDVSE